MPHACFTVFTVKNVFWGCAAVSLRPALLVHGPDYAEHAHNRASIVLLQSIGRLKYMRTRALIDWTSEIHAECLPADKAMEGWYKHTALVSFATSLLPAAFIHVAVCARDLAHQASVGLPVPIRLLWYMWLLFPSALADAGKDADVAPSLHCRLKNTPFTSSTATS